MAISVKDVEYLAHLARIRLTPAEIEHFAAELNEILEYVEKLKAAQTADVSPMSHVLDLSNVFREDQVQPSLPTESVLANVPGREGSFFKVPRIIEIR